MPEFQLFLNQDFGLRDETFTLLRALLYFTPFTQSSAFLHLFPVEGQGSWGRS